MVWIPRILLACSLQIVKSDEKGWYKGSEKPLLCMSPTRRLDAEGEGRVKSS